MAKLKTFEEKMARLNEIAGEMERGDVPLDRLVSLFEEGTALSKELKKYIDRVKVKIETLTAKEIEEDEPDGGEDPGD